MDTPETMPSHWTPQWLTESSAQPVLAVAIAYIVLNTVFVVLRFVSRYYQRAGWGWDDPLVFVSWMVNLSFFISEIVHIVHFKAGRRTEFFATRPDLRVGLGMLGLYIQPISYCIAVVPPRLAILILYVKIFTSKALRVACYVIAVLITTVAIVDIFAVAFMCNPRAKAWQSDLPGECLNIENLYIWGTFPNFFFDIIILVLPIPSVWRLQTQLQVKIGLLATFAVGGLGLITAILRWSAYLTDRFVDGGDGSWSINPLEIYIMTEMSTYLICACLLTLRTLLHKVGQTRAITSLHRWLLCSSKAYGKISVKAAKQTRRNPSGAHPQQHKVGSTGHQIGMSRHGTAGWQSIESEVSMGHS